MKNGRRQAPIFLLRHTEQRGIQWTIGQRNITPSALVVATIRFPDVGVRLAIQTARRLEANRAPVLIRPNALTIDASGLHPDDLPCRYLALHRLCLSGLRPRQSLPRALTIVEPDVFAIGRTFPTPLTNDKGILNGGSLGVTQRHPDFAIVCAHDRPVGRPIPGHQHLAPPSPAARRQLGSASVQCGQFGLGHRCLVGHVDVSKPIRRAHASHRRCGKTWRTGERHRAAKPNGENQGIEAEPLQLHRDGVAARNSAKVVTEIV